MQQRFSWNYVLAAVSRPRIRGGVCVPVCGLCLVSQNDCAGHNVHSLESASTECGSSAPDVYLYTLKPRYLGLPLVSVTTGTVLFNVSCVYVWDCE